MGKVNYDRPKTLEIENLKYQINAHLYIECNPVKSGKVKHPTHYKYSSCNFYATGKKNEWTKELDIPQWYLDLGPTPAIRQKRFRKMLDKYLRKNGFINDQEIISLGTFIGQDTWVKMRCAQLSDKTPKQLLAECANSIPPP